MPKLQKYEQKIRKYKEKLKKVILRIGISYPKEFELLDVVSEKILLPCHLGILFFGEFNNTFFKKIKAHLNEVFDSFFFDIRNLGDYNFSNELFSKGLKKEYKEMKKSSNKIKMHPTNKFYQILIDKRIQENLGMIIAITNLPIYSSSNDNILFLYGETHLKHRCGVISSFKLKEEYYNRPENIDLFENRVLKEICHEVGHLILGSRHCNDDLCIMRFSNEIDGIDNKSNRFCINCKNKLNEIRKKYNF
ncbi:MAG: hypothetical protein ACFE9Q_02480 [Candidatus Hodarchaeota archaeon]